MDACTNHPRAQAVYTCPHCSRPICTLCAFDVRGKAYCPDCATHALSELASAPQPTAPPPPPPPRWQPQAGPPPVVVNDVGIISMNLTREPPPAVPAGLKCVQHPDVDAVTRCRVCSTGVCEVCDFELPNGMHVCPACIENRSSESVSPKRTYQAWGGIALAAFTTIFLGLVFAGQILVGSDEMALKVIDIVILFCSVGGVALSFTAYEPNLGNSGVIMAATIWNSILLAVFVILSIVGTISG